MRGAKPLTPSVLHMDALATELARYEHIVDLARENQAFARRSADAM